MLAAGYTALYQGSSATGASPGVTVTGVNNGNLAAVEGSGAQPGPGNGVTFEPSGSSPLFLAPHGQEQPGQIATFRGRVTGQAVFHQRAGHVAHRLGFHNSIRADQGQPITFGTISRTGFGVTIS